MTDEGEDMGPDQTARHATYESFMAMTKWGIIVVTLALLLMAVFLV